MRQKTLGRLVIGLGQDIYNGDCGLDEDEIDAITEIICSRKLNMTQAAKFLNIDITTLRSKIRDEEIPTPRKEAGGKKYFFRKDLIEQKESESDSTPNSDS